MQVITHRVVAFGHDADEWTHDGLASASRVPLCDAAQDTVLYDGLHNWAAWVWYLLNALYLL